MVGTDFASDQVISCQMLWPTKEMEVRAETEYLTYRKAIDFESLRFEHLTHTQFFPKRFQPPLTTDRTPRSETPLQRRKQTFRGIAPHSSPTPLHQCL